ncbi:thioredoxin family protein [Raineyella fluvialis]|uniref:Thioredoxin n=1 Tax=Raineyella fluvialis TaxID=2662261 RepID=A0A5Q2FDD7_9ACTN|nr:thioredoxin family protein [Raineyella fluvialis]QGF22725.1 thioredoxin [Raineyella fluvialis]
MTGLIVLIVALAAATAIGLYRKATDGRARAAAGPRAPRLTAATLGVGLGATRTFVQFSSAVCTPCRRTRSLLEAVTAERSDVAYVDLDAEHRLDLVEKFGILRTPTVLVLDAEGTLVQRIVGQPRRSDVLELLDPAQPLTSSEPAELGAR